MNLAEMREDVRERLGERSANFWTDTFINRKLNQGQTQFAHEERWTWLYTIQSDIPVPQGTRIIELIDGIDFSRHFGLALYKVDSDEPILPKRVKPASGFRARRRYTATGEPLYYYAAATVTNEYESGDPMEVALTVNLVPATDQAYTAEYFFIRDPAKLTAEDQECELPEAYHEAVVAWATAQCWLKEMTGERKAQSEFNIYNAVLEEARADHSNLAIDEVLGWGADDVDGISPLEDYRRRLFTTPLGS